MSTALLRLLGLCKRSGNLAPGEDPAIDAINAHRARLLVTASDVSPHTLRKLSAVCGDRVPILQAAVTKAELGAALGWESCGAAAVLDMGFAVKVAGLIAEGRPEYAEVLASLTAKQTKMLRRKREKRKGPAETYAKNMHPIDRK